VVSAVRVVARGWDGGVLWWSVQLGEREREICSLIAEIPTSVIARHRTILTVGKRKESTGGSSYP